MEKRRRGRPRGSKNKIKAVDVASSSIFRPTHSQENKNIASVLYELKRGRVSLTKSWQRSYQWDRERRALLIYTILKGGHLYIPEMLWKQELDENMEPLYIVLDGKQRITTIANFVAGENGQMGFKLPGKRFWSRFGINSKIDENSSEDIADKRFSQLSQALRDRVTSYPLHVMMISNSSEEQEKELFLRINNGKQLSQAEKKNAKKGPVPQFIYDIVYSGKAKGLHPAFGKFLGNDDKSGFRSLVSQAILLLGKGGPTDISSKSINDMYNTDQISKSLYDQRKKTIEFLDVLARTNVREKSLLRIAVHDLAITFIRNYEDHSRDSKLFYQAEWATSAGGRAFYSKNNSSTNGLVSIRDRYEQVADVISNWPHRQESDSLDL